SDVPTTLVPKHLLSNRGILSSANIPRSVRPPNARVFVLDSPIGGTAMAAPRESQADCVVGTETGYVFRCSIVALAPLELAAPGPGQKAHALNAVSWSPHKPTVFVTAAADGNLYFYDVTRNRAIPVAVVGASEAGSGAGRHTTAGETATAAAAAASLAGRGATGVAFNARRADLLAACGADGRVRVWRVSTALRECDGREAGVIEALAKVEAVGK
ncbi:hypothetical protein HK405_003529, partial [Cladochytrium tenue]